MKKGVKIALILGTIGITGVGMYFLWKKVIKPKLDEKKDSDNESNRSEVSESQVKTQEYNKRSSSDEKEGSTPFKNQTEGDKFRKWVNDTYPKYAKEIDLDPSGSYDNRYIKKAWGVYGGEYEKIESGVVSVERTKVFQSLLSSWKKSPFVNSKGVEYFTLKFKAKAILYTDINKLAVGKTTKCEGKIYIFNQRPQGGKLVSGQGFWRMSWRGKVYAEGYYYKGLGDIKVTKSINGTTGNRYILRSGESVGAFFGQVMKWNGNNKSGLNLIWC